jgi:hypothetical protein
MEDYGIASGGGTPPPLAQCFAERNLVRGSVSHALPIALPFGTCAFP